MINPNILKVLESTMQDPSYSVMITNFQQIDSYCNKDKLIITTEQINPNVFKIIENKENIIELLIQSLIDNNIEIPEFNEIFINNVAEKQLSIESLLDFDINTSMFISALTGDLDNEKNKNIISPFLRGSIKNERVEIIEKDYPNYFNQNKFKIQNHKLIINVPKKTKTIEVKITKSDNTTDIYTETDIDNNKISIPIQGECDYTFSLSYTFKDDISSKSIESITTPLEPKIDISFNNIYSSLPAIIPTIDEDNKIYSTYTLSFETNKDNNYTGVSIVFKNFKKTKKRGDINIVIIGDKVD